MLLLSLQQNCFWPGEVHWGHVRLLQSCGYEEVRKLLRLGGGAQHQELCADAPSEGCTIFRLLGYEKDGDLTSFVSEK